MSRLYRRKELTIKLKKKYIMTKNIIKKLNNYRYLEGVIIKDKNLNSIVVSLFIISTIIRFYFSSIDKTILVYPDELVYLDVARSIINHGEILVHGTNNGLTQIIYPLMISPAMFFENTRNQILFASFLNCIYFSSTVFPAYLLSKQMINNNKNLLLILIIILVSPDFIMTTLFMAENVFYPACVWFFYMTYIYIKSERKVELVMSFICGLTAAVLFFIKSASIYITVSFCCMFLYEIWASLRGKTINKDIKKILYKGILFVLGFLIVYGVFAYSFGSGIGLYKGMIKSTFKLNSISKILFFIYINFQYVFITLIAFFVFPIIIPLLNFDKYTDDQKKLLIFAITSLVIAIIEITYIISMTEDFGKLSIRYHSRYFSPLFVVFLMFLFNIIEENITNNVDRYALFSRNHISLILILGIIGILVLKFNPITLTDSMITSIYSKVIYKESNALKFLDGNEVILKLSLVLVYNYLVICIYRCKVEGFLIKFIGLVLILSISCNLASFNNLRFWWDHYNEGKTVQVEILNEYIKSLGSKNVMINIPSQAESVSLDTYIDQDVYSVNDMYILSSIEKNRDYFDLNRDKLQSSYPYIEYEGLKEIDYIITSKNIDVEFYNVIPIDISGVIDYYVYKNIDNQKIYVEERKFFPTEVNKLKTWHAKDELWETHHEYRNGKYVSLNKGGYLIYGRYEPIEKGRYEIKVFYNYKGDLKGNTSIAYMDINFMDLAYTTRQFAIEANGNCLTVDIEIMEKSNLAEVRLFTETKDIEFNKLSIVKVD